MTLYVLNNKLTSLRESGANVDRRACREFVCEYLSDKTEVPRSVFNEIKCYIEMKYYSSIEEHNAEEEGAEEICCLQILTEEDKKRIVGFEYKDSNGKKRRIKVVD